MNEKEYIAKLRNDIWFIYSDIVRLQHEIEIEARGLKALADQYPIGETEHTHLSGIIRGLNRGADIIAVPQLDYIRRCCGPEPKEPVLRIED